MNATSGVISRDELLAGAEIQAFVQDMTTLLKLEIIQRARLTTTPAAGLRATRLGGATDAGESPVGEAVVKRLRRLPQARREAFQSRLTLTPQLRADAQRLGVATDARTNASLRPVLQQVDAVRSFDSVARSLRGGLLDRLRGQSSETTGGAVANQGIRFQMHEVHCVKNTNEIGKDEIALGAITIADDGTTGNVPESFLGKFKKGDRVTFNPPKELANFSFEGDFPKIVAVVVSLAEKDLGGFSEFLSELYEGIRKEVTTVLATVGVAVGAIVGIKIGAKLGAEVGTIIGGPIGVLIGAIAGAVLGALVAWLIDVAKDDIFVPQVADLTLLTADAQFSGTGLSSGPRVLTFADFGGVYQVRHSWELRR